MLVGAEAAWRTGRGSARDRAAERLEQIVVIALLATVAGGLGLLLGGGRPREVLHFVYAIVALGALTAVDSLSRRAAPRLCGVASLLGAFVALAVIVRLFQTG